MPKMITFDKGSKRRLKEIRWRLSEVISLALLSLLTIAVCALAVLWEMDRERYSEPTKEHQIREAEPIER
ncbi:hypothetical protein DYQ86_05945 [Acidobacteria bacterium AB60]|nr:hypothetical protein DYQ86_05945 [Acidobacteria bacterium AB60]